MNVIEINTNHNGYSHSQVINGTLTVAELIEILEQFDEDTKVIFSNDNGYTFGRISADDINERRYRQDD